METMILKSYSGHKSGTMNVVKDITVNPEGRHVLIVEDLIDSGRTLHWLSNHLSDRGFASVKLCCLFDKDIPRNVDVKVDYSGFRVGNEWIVGYGMDYDNKYRNVPHVCVLNPKVYMKNNTESPSENSSSGENSSDNMIESRT